MFFSERLNVSFTRHPGLPAIEDRGIWYTWGQVGEVARRLDDILATTELPAGTRIGLVARNRMPHVAALYGLLATGRTTVMIYAAFSPAALAKQILCLRLPAILADEEDWTSETIAAAAAVGTLCLQPTTDAANPILVVAEGNGSGASASDGAWPVSPDIAIEMLSSGTTGTPKRIPIRWDTLQSAAEDARLNFRQSGQQGLRDGQPVPFVQPAPLANIGGLYAVIPSGLESRPLALLEKFTVDAWLAAVIRHRPQVSWLAPASIQALWEADVPADALSSIVGLRTGSAPLSADLQRAFEQKYGLSILVTYGATEFCGVIVMWTLEDHERFARKKPGSAGRPRPGVQLRVVDAERLTPLGSLQTGILEILVSRVSDEWVHTTDLAMMDDDGFLYLQGRADDAINRGGFKVMPDPVADAIRRHPAVADAAVVGVNDARLGEVPVAAIVLHAGRVVDGTEMQAFLRSSLLAYQIPSRFVFTAVLPRTPSLKIDRNAVRALFEP